MPSLGAPLASNRVASQRATRSVARFALAGDEYEAIRKRLPALLLPEAGSSEVALDSLAGDTGTLEPVAQVGPLDPVMVSALALHSLTSRHLSARATSSAEHATIYASALDEAAAGLVIRSSRARSSPCRVELSLLSIDLLVSEVFALLPESGCVAAGVFEHVELPLSASFSVIEALRTGRGDLIAAVADELQAHDSIDVLGELSAPIDASFSVVATEGSRVVARHDWLLGANGWLKADILLPLSTPATAGGLAEGARVALTRVTPALIRAELLAIAASWFGGTHG